MFRLFNKLKKYYPKSNACVRDEYTELWTYLKKAESYLILYFNEGNLRIRLVSGMYLLQYQYPGPKLEKHKYSFEEAKKLIDKSVQKTYNSHVFNEKLFIVQWSKPEDRTVTRFMKYQIS